MESFAAFVLSFLNLDFWAIVVVLVTVQSYTFLVAVFSEILFIRN